MAYNRVRERDDRWKPTYSYTSWYYGGTLSQGTSQNPFKGQGQLQTVYDNKTSWPKKRPLVILNPCCMYKINGTSSCNDLIYMSKLPKRYDLPSRKLSGDWLSGMFNVGPTWPPSPINIEQRTLDIVSQAACAKKHEPPVDVATMVREGRETLGLLVNPSRSLVQMMQQMVRHANVKPWKGRFPSPRQIQDEISKLSDAWLQYRYGIVPLVHDIDAGIKAYENAVVRAVRPNLERSTAGDVLENTRTQTYLRQNHPSGWFNLGFQQEVSVKTVATGHVYWVRKWVSPMGQYGQDFSDLPNFLWELIPYSFVVDWVFSVGDWLRSITPDSSIDYLGNCVSLKTTISTRYIHTDGYEVNTGWPLQTFGSSVTITEERLVRVTNTPIPVTPVYLGPRLSIKRQIDALSLIWQKMPKLRR